MHFHLTFNNSGTLNIVTLEAALVLRPLSPTKVLTMAWSKHCKAFGSQHKAFGTCGWRQGGTQCGAGAESSLWRLAVEERARARRGGRGKDRRPGRGLGVGLAFLSGTRAVPWVGILGR